jgi:DNA-binding protein H-NS
MATVAELRAQAEELMRKATEQEDTEKTKLFEGILKKLEDAGQSFAALSAWATKSTKKIGPTGSLAAKFKGPNGDLWAGRGRQPAWVVELGDTPEKRAKALVAYEIK